MSRRRIYSGGPQYYIPRLETIARMKEQIKAKNLKERKLFTPDGCGPKLPRIYRCFAAQVKPSMHTFLTESGT